MTRNLSSVDGTGTGAVGLGDFVIKLLLVLSWLSTASLFPGLTSSPSKLSPQKDESVDMTSGGSSSSLILAVGIVRSEYSGNVVRIVYEKPEGYLDISSSCLFLSSCFVSLMIEWVRSVSIRVGGPASARPKSIP